MVILGLYMYNICTSDLFLSLCLLSHDHSCGLPSLELQPLPSVYITLGDPVNCVFSSQTRADLIICSFPLLALLRFYQTFYWIVSMLLTSGFLLVAHFPTRGLSCCTLNVAAK